MESQYTLHQTNNERLSEQTNKQTSFHRMPLATLQNDIFRR